jgi:hypothetical protein
MSSENELGAAGTPLPPPPVHKRHHVRNIVLTVLGVIFLGFVAFLGLGFYEIHKNGGVAKTGVAPANAAAPAQSSAPDFGVPIYSGATMTPAGVQTTVNPKGSNVTATYTTPDSPDLVAQFYQQQLGNAIQIINVPGSGMMMSAGTPTNNTSLIVTTDKGQTYINMIHNVSTGP